MLWNHQKEKYKWNFVPIMLKILLQLEICWNQSYNANLVDYRGHFWILMEELSQLTTVRFLKVQKYRSTVKILILGLHYVVLYFLHRSTIYYPKTYTKLILLFLASALWFYVLISFCFLMNFSVGVHVCKHFFTHV